MLKGRRLYPTRSQRRLSHLSENRGLSRLLPITISMSFCVCFGFRNRAKIRAITWSGREQINDDDQFRLSSWIPFSGPAKKKKKKRPSFFYVNRLGVPAGTASGTIFRSRTIPTNMLWNSQGKITSQGFVVCVVRNSVPFASAFPRNIRSRPGGIFFWSATSDATTNSSFYPAHQQQYAGLAHSGNVCRWTQRNLSRPQHPVCFPMVLCARSAASTIRPGGAPHPILTGRASNRRGRASIPKSSSRMPLVFDAHFAP